VRRIAISPTMVEHHTLAPNQTADFAVVGAGDGALKPKNKIATQPASFRSPAEPPLPLERWVDNEGTIANETNEPLPLAQIQ